MKRRLLIAAVLLLAGAVVNVAVAWGCALLGTEYETGRIEIVQAPRTYAVFVFTAFGREFVYAHPALTASPPLMERWVSGFRRMGFDVEARQRTRDWSIIRQSGMFSADPVGLFTYEEASGWPQACLRWYSQTSIPGGHDTLGALAFGGPQRHMMHGMTFPVSEGDRSLPLIPIWPGIAMNSLSYAVVLWLLCGGLFVARRWIRVRRGLCPKCAYPIGEAAVCTECGMALPNRAKMAT